MGYIKTSWMWRNNGAHLHARTPKLFTESQNPAGIRRIFLSHMPTCLQSTTVVALGFLPFCYYRTMEDRSTVRHELDAGDGACLAPGASANCGRTARRWTCVSTAAAPSTAARRARPRTGRQGTRRSAKRWWRRGRRGLLRRRPHLRRRRPWQ